MTTEVKAHANEVAFNYRPELRNGQWSVRGRVRVEKKDDGTWKHAQVWLNIPAKMVTAELREMFRSIPAFEGRQQDGEGNLIPTGTYLFKGAFQVTSSKDRIAYRTTNGVGASVNLVAVEGTPIEIVRPNNPVSDAEADEVLALAAEISDAAVEKLGRRTLGQNPNAKVQRLTIEDAAKELGGKLGKLTLA